MPYEITKNSIIIKDHDICVRCNETFDKEDLNFGMDGNARCKGCLIKIEK